MNIICRKTSCEYNKNFVCQVDGLKVSTNAECENYKKTKTGEDLSKKIFIKSPKYNQYRPVKDLHICCHADCQFAKDNRCCANGITINDLINKPYCVTYFKRIKN